MNPAFVVYMAISALAIAGWGIVALVVVCNAITRPDDALAGLMRLSHAIHHWAFAGKVALAMWRKSQADNAQALEAAVKPLDWRGM